MNHHQHTGRAHPHAVVAPDSSTIGVRHYREPDAPHPLQLDFLTPEGEAAWVAEIQALLNQGQAQAADARLAEALEGFNGSLARLCKATDADTVILDGFDDLRPILDEWEGPAITAITLGLTNPPDLAFEAGQTHEPELLLGLYSDESFPFGSASNSELLEECGKDMPAWIGAEEDVEFHLTIPGLAELNTALIHCKHRRFLRDGRDGVEGRAPGGYVEYVLGCWLLATRFLQAAQRGVAGGAVPAGCRLIAGTVEVNADFITVLGVDQRRKSRASSSGTEQPAFATLTVKPWVPREDPTAEPVPAPASLRQRLVTEAPGPDVAPRSGFLARLFGRFSRR